MSVAGLIATGILFLILAIYVLRPLLVNTTMTGKRAFLNKQRERAIAYYERVLTNIRDLDEDLATGKINPEEYETERELWVGRGIKLLKMLDQLDEQENIVDDEQAGAAEIDAAIEQAVINARQNTTPQRTQEAS